MVFGGPLGTLSFSAGNGRVRPAVLGYHLPSKRHLLVSWEYPSSTYLPWPPPPNPLLGRCSAVAYLSSLTYFHLLHGFACFVWLCFSLKDFTLVLLLLRGQRSLTWSFFLEGKGEQKRQGGWKHGVWYFLCSFLVSFCSSLLLCSIFFFGA